ncbi:MAG: hypothetical protein IKO52_14635 [Clostridia bacterium]|nr:hypothetical protein [Clostridia bacterium]
MIGKIRQAWAEILFSLLAAGGMAAAFFHWYSQWPPEQTIDTVCAAASALLFLAVLIRMLPGWVKALKNPEVIRLTEEKDKAKYAHLKVLGLFLLSLILHTALVAASRLIAGNNSRFWDTFRLYVGLDSNAYYSIAREGYAQLSEAGERLNLVFFPGYPLLTGLFMMVIPNEVLCGYVAAWLPFLASGPVLYDLLRLDFDHKETMRILILFCLAPAAVFYAYPMSESLFVLCIAGCLYLARTKRWFAAGIVGMLAAFTRSVGGLLLVPLAFEWWQQFKSEDRTLRPIKHWIRDACCLFLIPMGLVLYLYINFIYSGNPFIFLQYQKSNWHQHLSWFFTTAATQADYARHAFFDNPNTFFGLWLPNLTVGFSSLLLMLFRGRKMRPAYSAWFMVYFAVSYGASWLLSGPRYMAVFFPLAIAAETLPVKRKWVLYLIALPFAAAYTVLFALRWSVW